MVWVGRDWQDYCISLLCLRYSGHDLQVVPDRHLGDLGIEAYSLDGCLYQCYAALEPLSVLALYENQRDKLTSDIGKLLTNAAELWKLLGDLPITRYVLMVPRHDSHKLVQHAQAQSERVRAWGLPFVAPEFSIVIETDEHYGRERQALMAIPEHLVSLDEAGSDQVADWTSRSMPLLTVVREKLAALGYSGESLTKGVETVTLEFLTGENTLGALRDKFPDHWVTASQVKSRRERRLPLDYPPASATSPSVVPQIVDAMTSDMRAQVPSLSSSVAEQIAWGAVADWLMRCPLETRSQQ